MLENKNIVIGVTGGIAAFKVCSLVSSLAKQEAHVNVMMTEAATSFVTPETFQALSRNPVAKGLFQSIKYWEIEHISLSQKADIMIIAPATANIIGKIASGIADDFVSTAIMATTAPVYLVPAMNTQMYQNSVVQQNMRKLKSLGYHFIDPSAGLLACGDEGTGKMAEPSHIEQVIRDHFLSSHDLEGVRVLVTAGPTREIIDPVRYVTNRSSGKMGFALAKAAKLAGAEVSLVTGPVSLTPPEGVDVYSVESSLDMYHQVMELYDHHQVVIKSAAVADYRPETPAHQKIKKNEGNVTLKMVRNPDILFELGQNKKNHFLVGFAAETENMIEAAQEKMERKNLDLMVANDVSQEGAGFQHDTNEVTVMDRFGHQESIAKTSKDEMARSIILRISQMLKDR